MTEQTVKRVREPVIAGTWYPGDASELSGMISAFLDKAARIKNGRVRAVIAAHAGYPYSGQIAAHSYRQIVGEKYDKVYILAPSHYVGFGGVSITGKTHYRTPLGDVKISQIARDIMEESTFVNPIERVHEKEHSLEIQLPFLQHILGTDNFEIIPMVIGRLAPDEASELAETIVRHMDERTLIVASSDLSHYHPYDEAVYLDRECMDAIVDMDLARLETQELCGIYPVGILVSIAKKLGWKPVLVKYANSGDVTGDYSGVVGYAAIAFFDDGKTIKKDADDAGEKIRDKGEKGETRVNSQLTEDEGKELLKIARNTIESYVKNNEIIKPEVESPRLKEYMGCFVTLEKTGLLRGCIGHLGAVQPLYLDVRDNAINAAVNDPRFPPVSIDELEDIEIEISVLSPSREIEAETTEELIEKIRAGTDGIIIEKGGRSATYLPQVWEQIPGKEEFLESLCMKAGLNPGRWKDKDTKVFRYTVQAFSERALSK